MSRRVRAPWYMHEANSDHHPKIRKAGFWGARAYECLLRVDAEFRLGGVIPPHFADAYYLADRLQAFDILPKADAVATIAQALQDLASTQSRMWALIEIRNDGTVLLLGRMEEEEAESRRPMTDAERAKAYRDRKKAAAQAPTSRDGEGRHVTARDEGASSRPTRDVTLKEENRREEIRDPPPTPSAGAEGAADDPERLTPSAFVALWNELTGSKLGTSPEGKRLTGIRRCLKKRPHRRDWEAPLAKAKALRRAGCTWIDIDWLVRDVNHAERLEVGSFDFKLEEARRGPAPPPEPPGHSLAEGESVRGCCPACSTHTVGTWRGGRLVLADHPCTASPTMRRVAGVVLESDLEAEEVAHAAG